MSDDLAPLHSTLAGLAAAMAPGERRKLARKLAQTLRASQSERITAQQNPDGTPYAARKMDEKTKKGKIKKHLKNRGKMFKKLKTAKYLKIKATEAGAEIAFDANVQGIAKVHHYGLEGRTNKKSSIRTRYPARQLLGITDKDQARIEDAMINHIANAV